MKIRYLSAMIFGLVFYLFGYFVEEIGTKDNRIVNKLFNNLDFSDKDNVVVEKNFLFKGILLDLLEKKDIEEIKEALKIDKEKPVLQKIGIASYSDILF